MPRRDGLSVALTIREAAPHVPVSIITGHGSEAMAIQALRAGVTDFIKKPVHLEDLTSALNRMQAVRQLIPERPAAPMPAAVEVVRLSSLYRLDNSPDAVPTFVEMLLHRCSADTRSKAATELSLALRELILNAIEHGNLGLTFVEKSRALEQNTLDELLRQRARLPEYRQRRVTVEARIEDQRIRVRVADEGQGFDWRGLSDPTDPAHLLSTHGRGILLARMMVESLEFNEAGNQVTVTKRLAPHA
jgi:DNA-binding response OmpR family regulator